MSAIHDEQKMLFDMMDMTVSLLHKWYMNFWVEYYATDEKNPILKNVITIIESEINYQMSPLAELKVFSEESMKLPDIFLMSTPPQPGGSFSRLYNAY